MINLTTLSALLRSLRYSGGPDAPAAAVARVAPVTSLTPDDNAAMTAAALRVATRSHAQAPRLPLPGDDAHAADASVRDAGSPAKVLRSATAAGASIAARLAGAPPVLTDIVESTALDLTAGARLIQVAMRGSAGMPPLPPSVGAAFPLVENDHSATADIARGLARSVMESGLFYESHLARWVRRDYPASALLREPQSAWIAPAFEPAFSGSQAQSTLPEGASGLLARQLDALDTRALVWNGNLWPGQSASVTFEQDRVVGDEAEADDADAAASGWRTRVSIDLPSLGRVEATLVMRGATLDLMLEAEDPDARARLMHGHDALDAALAGANVALGNFGVAFGAPE